MKEARLSNHSLISTILGKVCNDDLSLARSGSEIKVSSLYSGLQGEAHTEQCNNWELLNCISISNVSPKNWQFYRVFTRFSSAKQQQWYYCSCWNYFLNTWHSMKAKCYNIFLTKYDESEFLETNLSERKVLAASNITVIPGVTCASIQFPWVTLSKWKHTEKLNCIIRAMCLCRNVMMSCSMSAGGHISFGMSSCDCNGKLIEMSRTVKMCLNSVWYLCFSFISGSISNKRQYRVNIPCFVANWIEDINIF